MIKRYRRTAMSAALMLGASMLAPAALAQTMQSQAPQQQPPQQQAPQQQAPAQGQQSAPMMKKPDAGPAPSSSELKHFVNAALDVQAIGQQAQPKLKAATSKSDRMKLQQATEAKMKTAVQKHHLSVKRYQQIFVAMQTDNTVRQKVSKMVQAKQKK